MARTDKNLTTLYNRVATTKRRLNTAITEGQPAKVVAHLQALYEGHVKNWQDAKKLKIRRKE